MASLIKKPSSRYFFACFRDMNGSQRRRTTGQTDRKKAQRIADHYEDLAQRRIKSSRVRETTNELIREFYGEEVPSATVRQFYESWLAEKKAEVSPFTLVTYEKTASKFLAYLGAAADSDIADVRKAQIIAFRKDVMQSVSAKTANFDLKMVRSMFRKAKADGYLVEDPAEFVDNVRREGGGPVRRPFTLDELRDVLAAAEDEWRSMILFGLYTGQRLSDIAALTWSNIDLEDNEIRLVTRKTGKSLTIPIAEPLRTHIASLPAGDDPAQALHRRAFRVVASRTRNASRLSKEFVDLLASVGIRKPLPRTRTGKRVDSRRVPSELSFHCLRHTAVSLLKDAGVPQAVVQELIGHDSAQMSQQYTHVGIEALQKATAALPDLGGIGRGTSL
jgi:integrase